MINKKLSVNLELVKSHRFDILPAIINQPRSNLLIIFEFAFDFNFFIITLSILYLYYFNRVLVANLNLIISKE